MADEDLAKMDTRAKLESEAKLKELELRLEEVKAKAAAEQAKAAAEQAKAAARLEELKTKTAAAQAKLAAAEAVLLRTKEEIEDRKGGFARVESFCAGRIWCPVSKTKTTKTTKRGACCPRRALIKSVRNATVAWNV